MLSLHPELQILWETTSARLASSKSGGSQEVATRPARIGAGRQCECYCYYQRPCRAHHHGNRSMINQRFFSFNHSCSILLPRHRKSHLFLRRCARPLYPGQSNHLHGTAFHSWVLRSVVFNTASRIVLTLTMLEYNLTIPNISLRRNTTERGRGKMCPSQARNSAVSVSFDFLVIRFHPSPVSRKVHTHWHFMVVRRRLTTLHWEIDLQ